MAGRFDFPDAKTTAGEISRNFGYWQDIAIKHPVLVTHHGRPRVVVLSSDEYFKLCARKDIAPGEAQTDPVVDGVSTLSAHMLEGFVWLDADLRVRALNSVAAANMGLDVDEAVTLDFELLAKTNESMASLVSWLRRVQRTSEAVRFEMAGVTGSGRSYSMCAFPFRGGVAYTYLQETEIRDLRRLAGRWRAELDAVNALYEVAVLRLNPSGYIEEANDFLSESLGFSRSELARARLIDIITPADRDEIAAGLRDIASGAKSKFIGVCSLMLKASGQTRLKISCTPILHDGVCAAIAMVGVEA